MSRFDFHPVVSRWFEEKFGTPTEAQEGGWPAILTGANVLIAAPTGSGKTLAAFLAALDQLFRAGLAGTLQDETRVLYVSPLKALGNDIHKNLEEPLAGLRGAMLASEGRDILVRAEVRTGDTTAARRQAMLRKPPHILVTTPESLYLLLTTVSGRKALASVRTLIVDEIHAVAGNRRGSHLALSMERLAALCCGPLQRIGLSATQKPIEEVARFLVGTGTNAVAGLNAGSAPLSGPGFSGGRGDPGGRCTIVDAGHQRDLDVAVELPGSPLEAVMSNEVWAEVYERLVGLIEEHRTTLIFVNNRRLAERVAHQLAGRLGEQKVTSHHGSLSAKLRLDAEDRLKRGELKALVATASLELGIDIGSVDLVCQLGPTRSIATFLQRVGRAGHRRGGRPKGRLFPLTRDELVECLATLRSVRRGELDRLRIPPKPLDVLAQQIVACAAAGDWDEADLFALCRRAHPYRELQREEFDEVVRMLAEGFSTKRGRRGALLHHDGVNQRVRARRGARLVALTSGGAIPDNADYRVVVHPSETFIGTVNEDFAVESMAGDIFQLGNSSWKILQVNSGVVRVEDARGQPPGLPFWLGEAPGRTPELSSAVSDLRAEVDDLILGLGERSVDPAVARSAVAAWLLAETGVSPAGAAQLAEYLCSTREALGAIPSQHKIVMERFFDESGGMQLVIHSPFGSRLNRAWGLALRKRFCRSFNFELQAAATDDAIVLSLGTQHSFPLDEVFRYLSRRSVRELLVQALFDSPMFPARWRWNASRALALPRQRGGRKVPAPLQRMEAENLIAAVFPDQLACLENIAGDRVVPDHPLIRQTIEDCLTEAMDIEGLEQLLQRIEGGTVECIARDLPEPSLMAHEILHAKPYAFLDNAPLEERRTQAVHTRRAGEVSGGEGLGMLDAAAIVQVCAEAWPRATNPEELHDALLLCGALTVEELSRCCGGTDPGWIGSLAATGRAGLLTWGGTTGPATAVGREQSCQGESTKPPDAFWVAAERLPLMLAIYPGAQTSPPLIAPLREAARSWERSEALRELVRGRMEVIGPVTAAGLAAQLRVPVIEVEAQLIALEQEGVVLRGSFHREADGREWCDRRLLARIHRLTIHRLRKEIEPVTTAEFLHFLLSWQRVSGEHRVEGPAGVAAVLEMFDGYELASAAWEPEILALRVKDYHPRWLDQLCVTGRIGWGRLSPSRQPKARGAALLRSSPVSLFHRDNLIRWLEISPRSAPSELAPDARAVLAALTQAGALFFPELVRRSGLLPSRVEQALGELAALGYVTADTFEGLRALLLPQEKRAPSGQAGRRRRHQAVTGVEFAGRWSLLRSSPCAVAFDGTEPVWAKGPGVVPPPEIPAAASEQFARVLLRRYGVVFRRLLERESLHVSWFELGRIFRRLEARGEIRGGHFVSGVGGEQFALPEAIGQLRSSRKARGRGELIALSAADPLNLVGILTTGPRIPSITANRILLRDGVPVAGLEAGRIIPLPEDGSPLPAEVVGRALRAGTMPASLRPYYG